ncbi:unnamed protein product [Arctia plantaginis]|uniref:Uncharacterized protein n=1 Tax=Arctia plantaginis TaxID=874455 RepID=A0A8S1BKV7_ARCPL|nr:unnamed protein product [Arctia plantaginis]
MLDVASPRVLSYTYKVMEIIDDLPVKSDLEKYLSALEKIVYFAEANKFYVDLNLCLGIYLVNVNLKNIVKQKGHLLPFHKQVRLDNLVKTNDNIIGYFSKMTQEHLEQQLQINHDLPMGILHLYTGKSSWPKRMRKFNIDLLKKTKFYSRKRLEDLYQRWSDYMKGMIHSTGSPTPEETDHCLKLLAQNPINPNNAWSHCHVPYDCIEKVSHGVNRAYGINRRLLFLLAARHWRGCVVLPAENDKDFIDTLCAKMYNEIEYIANHDLGLPDVVMEHMSLCSLEGHTQFMRRSWLDSLLDFQTEVGCFNASRPSDGTVMPKLPKNITWVFLRLDLIIWEGSCNSHTTAVAGSMLASVLRFIIENFY